MLRVREHPGATSPPWFLHTAREHWLRAGASWGGCPVGGGQLARRRTLLCGHCVCVPQVLRQLQQGLAKCCPVAFEKSGAVSDARSPAPSTVKEAGEHSGWAWAVSNVSTMFSSAASRVPGRPGHRPGPVFQKLKGQLSAGEVPTRRSGLHAAPRSCPSRLTASVAFLERSTRWAGWSCKETGHSLPRDHTAFPPGKSQRIRAGVDTGF